MATCEHQWGRVIWNPTGGLAYQCSKCGLSNVAAGDQVPSHALTGDWTCPHDRALTDYCCACDAARMQDPEVLTETTCPVDMLKETNPKDAVGVRKAPMSTVSAVVLAELGVAMMEGARKYGRHNYRVSGVRASVYYDATMRHLMAWWEGEDIDPASGLSHVTKAIASLAVLRDAMANEMWEDDRPPPLPEGWLDRLNKCAGVLIDEFPEPVPAFTRAAAKSA